ncbi:large extracellular alpha-helical protein [Pseudanabaena sp. lw0831]|nr:large extracellular alpha-helical protein [Pseudanabaena sp. lw0831]
MPPEVWEERIGYTVVQLDVNLRSATVLGFMPHVEIDFVSIDLLQPIESLCVAIANLRASTPQVSSNSRAIANLSNWLQDLFESGWQELETLLDGNQPQYAWRNREFLSSIPNASNLIEVRRGKLIDLGLEMFGCLVALVITISQVTQNETNIRLAIYPMTDTFLPEFLKLVILDDAGNIFLQVQARSIDNYIQLQLSGNTGENFSVQVSLAEVLLTENFVI